LVTGTGRWPDAHWLTAAGVTPRICASALCEPTASLAIHDLEHRLRQGKLTFASPQRMERYLGLEPGSVSPFGLINDAEHHVHLFLDRHLQTCDSLSFHPNDCRATVVISRPEFERYLSLVGNTYEYLDLYD
jgi:Ala-tRNA(Pro) deacylase